MIEWVRIGEEEAGEAPESARGTDGAEQGGEQEKTMYERGTRKRDCEVDGDTGRDWGRNGRCRKERRMRVMLLLDSGRSGKGGDRESGQEKTMYERGTRKRDCEVDGDTGRDWGDDRKWRKERMLFFGERPARECLSFN